MKLVVDRSLHQRARRAGADLALVQREHGEAFERLVEEVVVLGHHVGEEDVGRLAAELERHRDHVLGRVLHDQPAGRGLAGERDLGDARVLASGLPASMPKPLTTLSTPGGSRSPMRSISTMMLIGVCSAGFRTTQLPAASAGASFQTPSGSGSSTE